MKTKILILCLFVSMQTLAQTIQSPPDNGTTCAVSRDVFINKCWDSTDMLRYDIPVRNNYFGADANYPVNPPYYLIQWADSSYGIAKDMNAGIFSFGDDSPERYWFLRPYPVRDEQSYFSTEAIEALHSLDSAYVKHVFKIYAGQVNFTILKNQLRNTGIENNSQQGAPIPVYTKPTP